jgi:hypothetical protein
LEALGLSFVRGQEGVEVGGGEPHEDVGRLDRRLLRELVLLA